MYSLNGFRTLAAFALLSSPWIAAQATPVLSGSPTTQVVAAHWYAFQPSVVDPGKTVTFSIMNKPYWAQFNSATGRIAGTPSAGAVGTFSNIVISASDDTGRAYLAPFSITVKALPAIPPQISGTPAGTATVGQAYSFQPTASDPNGLRMVFAITGKPAWASFDSTTGRLSGTPGAADVGTNANISIVVYDGYMKSVLPTFSIVVAAAGSPTSPSTGSATVSWVPPAANTDGSALVDLSGYRIYYGTAANNLSQSVTVGSAASTRYVLSGLAAQTWYFSMTAYNSAGGESARSAVTAFAVQ
ncbi:MAG TPA: putative Ig domain-containing protein [Steroidobacteraceae bacterium]